ncbi:MAG: sensor histidine kinase [Aridibacter sp.]
MRIFTSTLIRLTAWYVGVLAFILILFALITYFLFNAVMLLQIDTTSAEVAAAFEKTVIDEFSDEEEQNNPDKLTDAVNEATINVGFKNYKVIVFSADINLIAASKTDKFDTDISMRIALEWLAKFSRNSNIEDFVIGDKSFRVLFYPFQVQDKKFNLLVVHPLEEQLDLLQKIRYAFLITVPLALIFASFGGYFLARKSFKPIAEMNEKAEEITARNLHERLPVENEFDELGRLAETFNRLLSRLDLSFEQQKRFMADASHELRTPVAIVRGEAEVSLTKDNRKPTEYRETISIMQKEAERMSKIIEDLFTLSRADAGENPVQKKFVYLEDILEDIVKSFRSIAAKRDISILFDSKTEMPLQADEQLLQRLFSNLVDNAVKHSKTFVKINAARENGNYRIEISDDGSGIPAENQKHIFERFYRADFARSRSKNSSVGSGAGLGLSISKWIAEIHNGTIELTKSNTDGSVFTVKFSIPQK